MAITISGTNGIVGAGFTLDASGASVTAGVGTFGSLNAPAAGLTGALPAISAASCTSIPAANIVGLATAGFERSGGFPQGITVADQWRVSSEFTFSASGGYITSNWERVDTDGFSQLGSGMTESSGVFSFPSTGIYLINFFGTGRRNSGNDRFGQIDLYTTVDNSSYTQASSFYVCAPSQYNRNTGSLSFIFDVTDVSTHKFKFYHYENHGTLIFQGNTNINYNGLTILRLGDT